MATTINLKVTDIKRIRTPYDGTDPEAEGVYSTAGRTYVAAVRLQDVPQELSEWRRINVRDPQMTSGVAKGIVNSLRDNPEAFFFKNRGITVIASDIKLKDKSLDSSVDVIFENPETNGLLDGSHTYTAIRDYIEDLRAEDPAKVSLVDGHIKFEIIVGLKNKEDIVSVVEARNTSTQVKEESLQELAHHFDTIKKVLRGKPYSDRIAYKEIELAEDGSKKDIDIKELLSYVICFDAERYAFDSKDQPVSAYASKAAIVKYFKDDSNRERLEKYIPLLPDILELHDRIYADLPQTYNDTGGAFGKLTGVSESKKAFKLAFSGEEVTKQIPSAFVYPILAAFRALVKVGDRGAEWLDDPFKVWEAQKNKLAESVGEEAKKLQNPNKMGKQKSLWEQCYRDILIARLTATAHH